LQETCRLDGEAGGIRKSEVLIETTGERRREMGVTVDETGEQGLSASVIHLGVWISFQNRVALADRRDAVAFNRERHVVLNGIDVHDGGVREHDGPTRGRLTLETAWLEEEGRGAGPDAREQVPAADGGVTRVGIHNAGDYGPRHGQVNRPTCQGRRGAPLTSYVRSTMLRS
jgi:hypothetical protein